MALAHVPRNVPNPGSGINSQERLSFYFFFFGVPCPNAVSSRLLPSLIFSRAGKRGKGRNSFWEGGAQTYLRDT